MKERIKQKGFIQIPILVAIIVGVAVIGGSIYFLIHQNQQRNEQRDIQSLLADLTKAVNLMEGVKDKLPKELSETHQYLVNQIQNKELKLVATDQKLKDLVMYHGAKTGSIYVNTSIKLKPELWIPIFYHEVAHNYWHTKNPVETFEEFEAQLFNSENYAYTVNSQAWDLVMRHYPIKKDELKTELEQRLFKIYSNETEVYNEIIKGNPEAKELWNKIIEEDIKLQKEQQAKLD